MRRKLLLLSLALVLTLCGTVYAAGVNGSYQGKNIVRVTLDGREVQPDSVPGYLDGSSTMIPLATMRKFGVTVQWNQQTLTANVIMPPVKRVLTDDDITLLSNRSVALIQAVDDQGKVISRGSGFVVSPDGLLLTAHHMAEENGAYLNLKVTLNGKDYLIPKDQYVYRDKDKDLYITKLPSGLYDYIPFNSDPLKEHDAIYALGYPKGVPKVVSGEIFFQNQERIGFKATIDHGNSGGPLVNQYGEAVGVVQNGDNTINVGIATGGTLVKDLIK